MTALTFTRGHKLATQTTSRTARGEQISYHDYDLVVETQVGYVLVTRGSGFPVLRIAIEDRVYTRRIARRDGPYSARGLVWVATRFAREIAHSVRYRTGRNGVR